ncbi:MAG: hypothetical protein OXG24_12110 [Gammaproteobacteria bacterium]|nr:hypothetical protein [Gammaproteobacteria bacterium]
MPVPDSMQKAKRSVNRQSDFRKLGSAQITIDFNIGKTHNTVEFDAFSIGRIRDSVEESELRDIGSRVRMTQKQWNFYLRRRKSGKLPTLVAFNLENDVLDFASPMDRLHFLRVHKTIQAFVDAWARYS